MNSPSRSIAAIVFCATLSLVSFVACGDAQSIVNDDGGDTDGGARDGGGVVTDGAVVAAEDLAGLIASLRSDSGAPAQVAAAWRDGQLVGIGVAGVRRVDDPTAATTADRWHLGSNTKAMTATLIGLHVDRGVIHFDDTIGSLFASETVDPSYAGVTIEQLLRHRGGAPGTFPSDIWSTMWSDFDAPDARINAVRSLLSRPAAQAKGTYVYSNAGYVIAGVALERLTGKTWEQLMQSELFAPLAMTSCGFAAPGTAGGNDQPWGHEASSGGILTALSPGAPRSDNPPSLGPAGTVHCSLTDWGRFLDLHLAGARGQASGRLVTQATLTRLQTPPSGGDYAAGWVVTTRNWAGGKVLTHEGSNTMWFATVWLAPTKNLAFATITNRGGDPASVANDQVIGALIQRYAP